MAGKMSSLEQRLNELEKIATDLESGNLAIDDAIAQYSKAIEMVLSCRKTLDEMEQKIALAKSKTQVQNKETDEAQVVSTVSNDFDDVPF